MLTQSHEICQGQSHLKSALSNSTFLGNTENVLVMLVAIIVNLKEMTIVQNMTHERNQIPNRNLQTSQHFVVS